MQPLTLEETRLLEEMKERCLSQGRYIDENAKAKFDMLCHLEDFEIQYWNLKEIIDKAIKYVEDYTSAKRIITYGQYKSELLDILKGSDSND